MTALYIFATVFGLGIVVVDFFMMLSSSGGGDDTAFDSGDGGDVSSDDSGHQHHPTSHPDGSVVGHQRFAPRGGFLLKTIGMFRHVIYFCVGFGPIGLFAHVVEETPFAIIWALGAGVIVSAIAALFRSIQSDKLDSTVNESSLLLEKATVLVSVGKGKMGKVRVVHGGMNIDRFAMTKNDMDEFQAGEEAVISEIHDDYVIIEPSI